MNKIKKSRKKRKNMTKNVSKTIENCRNAVIYQKNRLKLVKNASILGLMQAFFFKRVYNICMEIARTIKELRFEKSVSQEDVAKACQVQQSAVSKWERGATTPSADKIVLLAKFFEVTSDYLLGLEKHL